MYFSRIKDETSDKFRTFKALIETETRHPIKLLRTDRGGEFTSKCFMQYCDTYGINCQLTQAKILQQNEVAERRNRALVDDELLIGTKAPRYLWSKAINTTNCFVNRGPTRVNHGIISKEWYYNRIPNISHMHTQGYLAYLYVPRSDQNKLPELRLIS